MKAVLVIDMPNECLYCHMYYYLDICHEAWCRASDQCVTEYVRHGNKPDWCPLKPMPNIKNDDTEEKGFHIAMFNYGWNECLKEIEK